MQERQSPLYGNHHPFFEFEAMGKRDPVLIIGIIYPSSRQLQIFT